MRAFSHSRFQILIIAAAGMAMTGLAVSASAEGLLDRAKKRHGLVAGVRYLVPEYKGGMKFRTAEAPDVELIQDAAQQLKLPVAFVRSDISSADGMLASQKADVVLAAISDRAAIPPSMMAIDTGYTLRPMAIMRSDTDIKAWEQLKGRKVCVSEGGLYVGKLAAKYGAIEQVVRAPADSLLALRIGACDAAVHDSALLEELGRLPEWKKFSARLSPGAPSSLAFLIPATDSQGQAGLKRVVNAWSSSHAINQLSNKRARQIAFEVYLDQDVPDCH